MITNHQRAITGLEIFAGCIESQTLPGKASQAHRLVIETINESGLASRKHRVGKPSAHSKAIAGMLSALQVVHTWASFEDGQELVPEHVIKLTKKAIDAYQNSRINLKP